MPGSSPLARGLLVALGEHHVKPGIIPARAGFTRTSLECTEYDPDHPRSRGVYNVVWYGSDEECGSSPLARGLPRTSRFSASTRRIIPARAGFTRRIHGRIRQGGDHPRSRGVYAPACSAAFPAAGSSPLARGLRAVHRAGHHRLRIIPARAGFTIRPLSNSRQFSDHPRSRGVYDAGKRILRLLGGSSPLARGLRDLGSQAVVDERIIPARAGFTNDAAEPTGEDPGSSPLARGLREGVLQGQAQPRIIPARAGFTVSRRRASAAVRDHPRSRGVYIVTRGALTFALGSSPLARGLLTTTHSKRKKTGIIPARAGFTPAEAYRASCSWDHPRSRGVYRGRSCSMYTGLGSSPLARGLRAHHSKTGIRGGIIPARAGFTVRARGHLRQDGDHPRSRGVYQHHRLLPARPRGSSPLARGLQPLTALVGRPRGIIPARAGFTLGYPLQGPIRRGSSPLARGLHGLCGRTGVRHRIIPARAGFTLFAPSPTATP